MKKIIMILSIALILISSVSAYRIMDELDQAVPVSYCSGKYLLEASYISKDSVKFKLNDEISDTLHYHGYYQFKEGSAIFVREILEEEAGEGADKVYIRFYPAFCVDDSVDDAAKVAQVQTAPVEQTAPQKPPKQPLMAEQPAAITNPFDADTTQSMISLLSANILVVEPSASVMKKGEEKQFAVGFTNKDPEPANFSIKVVPLNISSDFKIASSPYSKTLRQNDKRLTPVYIIAGEDITPGKHLLAAELYKNNQIYAKAQFLIEVEKPSFFARFIGWLRGLLK